MASCSSSSTTLSYKNLLDVGLFDDFEDVDFEDDFDFAVDNLVAKEDVRLNCPDCKNTYKTSSGLQRHIKTKHGNNPYPIELDVHVMQSLLKKAVDKVKGDECWRYETRSVLNESTLNVTEELKTLVNQIVLEFSSSNDPELFYEQFYGIITIRADELLTLPLISANLVMIHFGELVFGHLKKCGEPKQSSVDIAPIVKESEVDALQYVAGYVIHKFLKKAKKSNAYNSKDNQAIILILEVMIDSTRELRLVDSINRGGLKSISRDCELLFLKTEEYFRGITNVPNLRKIDIPCISSNLLCQPDIISIINCIVIDAGCTIETEVKNNFFEKMVQLYLRVRSFALARDITTSSKKKSAKAKALRKELKRSINDQS